eukprot:EC714419.1.p3 GENE.EC714419.1~~EC714419.1.p3  ORF type:complete len:53 (+),score=1.99 EC714419.1:258-416(+)
MRRFGAMFRDRVVIAWSGDLVARVVACSGTCVADLCAIPVALEVYVVVYVLV